MPPGEKIAQLEAKLDEHKEELLAHKEQIKQLRLENRLLREKLDRVSRRLFGKSSEKLSADQLDLAFDELLNPQRPAPGKADAAWAEQAASLKPKARKRARPAVRLPEDLPVIETVVEPEEVKAEPEAWRRIGQEVSELIDYEPARFQRLRTIRPKYVHRSRREQAPIIAPLEPSMQERLTAGPRLLAQVVVAKYCDHLPLYRQEEIYARRHGVWLPRQTLARWIEFTADWLRLLYHEIEKEVFADGYAQVDETPIEYLAPGNGKTKTGYLWTACNARGDVFYRWETSRAAACLQKLIPVNFRGTLQTDGYAAYPSYLKNDGVAERISLAGCWAHVRRGFFEALKNAPQHAGWILHQIQLLYRIEERLRSSRAGPALRAAIRSAESRPIIDRIEKALHRMRRSGRFLPRSSMGKAIAYALGQWQGLLLFLENGQLEADNNKVENAIRPTAIGKKNWLFIGDAEAGERSAILFTIVENCRRIGIDPSQYLSDILTRLPTLTNWQIKDITPRAWAQARSTAALQLAA